MTSNPSRWTGTPIKESILPFPPTPCRRMIFLSLGLSLALFYTAMRYIGAGRAGLISSSSILWGVVGALMLLGESLTPKVLAGASLMVVGLIGFAYEANRDSSTSVTG